jgi:FAD:protein FMN transferase
LVAWRQALDWRPDLAPQDATPLVQVVKRAGIVLAINLLAGLVSAAESRSRFEAVEPHMGTLFHIELYATDKEQASKAFEKAFARIHELDLRLSDYNPDSEAMRLCRNSQGRPLPVSRDLFLIVKASLRLSETSSGAFDVTQGRVIRLWRKARETHQLPTAEEIKAASSPDWRDIKLDEKARSLTVPRGVFFDFGAIAKGYAADEALAVLRAEGIESALVAASGDIAMGAAPVAEPDRAGWKVGLDWIEAPLRLVHSAISTSGDAEQFVDIDGKRYSHIIDARTGQALTTRWQVTVIAPRGIDADPLATTLTILGPDLGLPVLKTYPGAKAIFFDGITHRMVANTLELPLGP